MNTRNMVLGSAMALPLFLAKSAQAQRVNADIRIGGGPIAGRVIIGDRGRDGYGVRPRPIGGVEWIRSRDYRRDDWWGGFQRNSRVVVVYYDSYDGNYYLDRYRPDLLEIRAYERDGRFYRLEEDGQGPRYDVRYDDRDGRYDGRNNGGWDDRRDVRRDDRRDDRRDVQRDDRRDRRDGRDDRQGRQDGRGDRQVRQNGRDHRDHRDPGGSQ